MSEGLWVLLGIFTLAAVLGAPLGLAMLTAGYVYLISIIRTLASSSIRR